MLNLSQKAQRSQKFYLRFQRFLREINAMRNIAVQFVLFADWTDGVAELAFCAIHLGSHQ